MEADRDSDRERALKTVAIGLAQAGRYDDALEVARALRVYQEQADALTDLAHALIQAGRIDEALEAAHAIEDNEMLTWAISILGKSWLRVGKRIRC